MKRVIECFYPGSSFPAISVTGSACALSCKHCARKYLESMTPATTPEDLEMIAEALSERGGRGFLLSGGVDGKGRVPLSEFIPAIKEIKKTTDLKINAHIGLCSDREISELVRVGIDSFSVDIYGSNDTIREVLGLDATVDDYVRVVSGLIRHGAQVVAPHICIGIHGGHLVGEMNAIGLLRPLHPKVLILISMIPTKGTAYASALPPRKQDIVAVIRAAKEDLPGTKLVLGCMRSKLDRSYEHELIGAGLDGIVLPSASTVDRLRVEGYTVRKTAMCCSFV